MPHEGVLGHHLTKRLACCLLHSCCRQPVQTEPPACDLSALCSGACGMRPAVRPAAWHARWPPYAGHLAVTGLRVCD